MSKPPSFEERVELCGQARAPELVGPAPEAAGERKWMAVSQLQKAVRRGESEVALRWARALWEQETNYGLFRMAVIACEEIACADPALARAFLSSQIRRDWFEERGGFSAFAYFVEAFCASEKDRSSCDVASLASSEALGAIAPRRGALDPRALEAAAKDPDATLASRVTAFWLLSGTDRAPNPALGAARPGNMMSFLRAFVAVDPDPDAIACAQLSLRLNKEPNPIALALCRASSKAGSTRASSLRAPTRVLGQGLTCGVDAHTREGREAISDLLAREPAARALCKGLRSDSDQLRALGRLFFRLEGHECAPRREHEVARAAREWHEARAAEPSGLEPERALDLAASLLPALDALRAARAPWALGAPAEPRGPKI